MLGQFAEGLIAELNRAEADPGVALLLRRMQLAHGEHALAVALRVEGHRDVKAARIVILIRSVLHFDQPRRFDAQEDHAVVPYRSVGPGEDETPATARADIALQSLHFESVRSEPLHDLLRIGPGHEHAFAR